MVKHHQAHLAREVQWRRSLWMKQDRITCWTNIRNETIVVETTNKQDGRIKPKCYWSIRRDIGITENHWKQHIKQKHRTSNTRDRRNVSSTSTSSVQQECTNNNTKEYGFRPRVVWWGQNKVWRLVEGNPIIPQEQ